MFIDTHCYIYKEYYDNIDEIINISENNNVNRFSIMVVIKNSNEEILSLINKYPTMYDTIGIYQENVNDYKEHDIDFIKII